MCKVINHRDVTKVSTEKTKQKRLIRKKTRSELAFEIFNISFDDSFRTRRKIRFEFSFSRLHFHTSRKVSWTPSNFWRLNIFIDEFVSCSPAEKFRDVRWIHRKGPIAKITNAVAKIVPLGPIKLYSASFLSLACIFCNSHTRVLYISDTYILRCYVWLFLGIESVTRRFQKDLAKSLLAGFFFSMFRTLSFVPSLLVYIFIWCPRS